MSRPLRYRPEIGRFSPLNQIRAERRLPPGPPLETETEPWYARLVVWLARVVLGVH